MSKILASTLVCAVLVAALAVPAPSMAMGHPASDRSPRGTADQGSSAAATPDGDPTAAAQVAGQQVDGQDTGAAPAGAVTTLALTPTPAAAAALRPKLRKGSTGPAVVYVQQQLGVTPTSGWYGPLTRRAVKKLQAAAGLARTGRVTRSTWRALFAAAAATPAKPAPAPEPPPVAQTPEQAAAGRPALARGMGPGDPAVIYVQRFLRVSPDSGYFGTLTTAAVTAYQAGLGLPVSGAVDDATWSAILAGRTVPVPPPAPAPPSATPDPSPPVASGYRYPLPANPTVADRALVFALAQVGKPYVLGGNGPDVFDCSGLVQQAFLSAGVALPRLASQQRFAGTRVELDELLPGDLLYYQDGTSPRSGHISMYAGNGLAVEAANPRRGVRIRDLDEPWYRDRFVAATRISG